MSPAMQAIIKDMQEHVNKASPRMKPILQTSLDRLRLETQRVELRVEVIELQVRLLYR